MGLMYDDNVDKFLIGYRVTDPQDGFVRAFTIPEFSNIIMPIISVLAIVGLKYQRKE